MGLNPALAHALSREQRFFIQPESTPGTFVRATSASAAKMLKFTSGFDWERIERKDNRDSRSLYEQILGKQKIDWELESYLIPSGTAGTAPDQQDLFQAVFGQETVSVGVSVTYALNNTQSGRQTVSLTRWANVIMETLRGCNVNSMKISAKGSEPAMVSFKGSAYGLCLTGNSTLDGAMSATASMVIESGDEYGFEGHATFGSIVQVGANTNSGTGYMVTARTGTTATLEATLSAADAADVLPFAPSETVVGSPIGGILGSMSIAGTTVPIIDFEVELDNGDKLIDDELGQQTTTDIIPGNRVVKGMATVRLRRDMVRYFTARKNSNFATRDLAVVLGTTAGSIVTVNIDRAEMTFASLEQPDGDSFTGQLPFKALASSSTASDELNIVFT